MRGRERLNEIVEGFKELYRPESRHVDDCCLLASPNWSEDSLDIYVGVYMLTCTCMPLNVRFSLEGATALAKFYLLSDHFLITMEGVPLIFSISYQSTNSIG